MLFNNSECGEKAGMGASEDEVAEEGPALPALRQAPMLKGPPSRAALCEDGQTGSSLSSQFIGAFATLRLMRASALSTLLVLQCRSEAISR